MAAVGPLSRYNLTDCQGYVQADAYPGYDLLFMTGKIIEVACIFAAPDDPTASAGTENPSIKSADRFSGDSASTTGRQHSL